MYLCTSVPLYLCIFAGGTSYCTYLGNLHIGQADKINAKIYMFFFSLGELLVFWFILVDWKMVDPRDATSYLLALGSLFLFFSFFWGGFFSLFLGFLFFLLMSVRY